MNTDRYQIPQGSSVFNVKQAHNDFAEALSLCKFENLIRNPAMSEQYDAPPFNKVFAWESSLEIDLLDATTSAVNSSWTVPMPNIGNYIRQDITDRMTIGHTFSATVRMSTMGQVRVSMYGGASDISDTDGTNLHKTEVTVPNTDGTVVVIHFRGTTRANAVNSTTKFAAPIYFSFVTDDASNVLRVEEITLNKGKVHLSDVAAKSMLFDNMRYNDASGFWELTNDLEEWHRILKDDDHFVARVQEIANFNDLYLTDNDVIAGTNITIEKVNDGTNVTLTISSTASGGVGGDGDWTREDMLYQALLEHSDFNKIYFDRFKNGTTMSVVAGSATWNQSGTYWSMAPASVLQTPDILLADASSYGKFVVTWTTELGTATCTYSPNGGANWYPAYDGTFISPVPETSSLLLRFTTSGNCRLASYGVLYDNAGAIQQPAIFMRERVYWKYDTTDVYPGDLTAGEIITLPNGALYHADGKSLIVNAVPSPPMILGVNYAEVDRGDGFGDSILLLADCGGAQQVNNYGYFDFMEFYGQADVSQDNALIIANHIVDTTAAHGLDSTAVNEHLNDLLAHGLDSTYVWWHVTATSSNPHNVNPAMIGTLDTTQIQALISSGYGYDMTTTATHGYVKLPSGLVLQWGEGGSITGGITPVAFLKPFTVCFTVFTGESNAAGWGTNSPTFHGPTPPNTTGFTMYSMKLAGGVASLQPGLGFTWFAIGL